MISFAEKGGLSVYFNKPRGHRQLNVSHCSLAVHFRGRAYIIMGTNFVRRGTICMLCKIVYRVTT